jgi:hypothetical protein
VVQLEALAPDLLEARLIEAVHRHLNLKLLQAARLREARERRLLLRSLPARSAHGEAEAPPARGRSVGHARTRLRPTHAYVCATATLNNVIVDEG